MMAKVDETVPDEFKVKLRQLFMRYSSVFSKDELDLGFTDLVTHRIDTGDARPVRQQLRRYPPAHLDVIDQHLHCLLYTSPSPRDRQKSRMPSSA